MRKTLKPFVALAIVALCTLARADVSSWPDFVAAINNANDGDTITLSSSFSWGDRNNVSISKRITINGNGCTITRARGGFLNLINYKSYYLNLSDKSELTLVNVGFAGSSDSGQAVMFNLASGAKLTLAAGAVIQDVTTATNGGAINNAGTVEIAGGRILNCKATTHDGGAIYSTGTVTMSAGGIEGCTAQSGGAIYNAANAVFTMTGGTLTDCTATVHGGAIYSAGKATLSDATITACKVSGVEGGGNGGAIYNAGELALSSNTSISGCNTKSSGGAVYTAGPLTLSGALNLSENNFGDKNTPNNIVPESATLIAQDGDLTGKVGVTFDQNKGAQFGVYASGDGAGVFYNDLNNNLVGTTDGDKLVWKDTTAVVYPDGTRSFEDVLDDARAKDGKVTVVQDLTETLKVPPGYDITIDLAGKKLTGGITAQGNVTITDSSRAKAGTVKGALTAAENGKFTIEYGAFDVEPPAAWLAEGRIVLVNYDNTVAITRAMQTVDSDMMVMDTRKGQVRVVNSPADDLMPLTYSADNFVFVEQYASGADTQLARISAIPVAEPGAPVRWHNGLGTTSDSTATNDGSFDYADGSSFMPDEYERALSAQPYESAFDWRDICYGLIQLVHTDANGNKSIAYFKFADPKFSVIQRPSATVGEYDFIINNKMFAALGYSRVGEMNRTSIENRFNALQANGLRLWENLVTGADSNKVYALDVDSVASANEKVLAGMPASTQDNQYGYSVSYELRKAVEDKWETVGHAKTKNEAFELATNSDSPDATGLYRIYTLIVPYSNRTIVNEIASTNTLGILRVESAQTNTMVAVPWRALASAPVKAVNVTVSNVVRTAHLAATDPTLMALDASEDKYEAWGLTESGHWEKAKTITADAGVVDASDPGTRELKRGLGFWLVRENPLDEKNAGRPFYLVGQFDGEDVTTMVKGGTMEAPGYTMLGAPGIKPIRINDIPWGTNPLANDVITVPVEGRKAPLALTWRNEAWGCSKATYDPASNRIISTRVTEIEIPAGTAFWYARRGAAFTFKWTLEWPKAVK